MAETLIIVNGQQVDKLTSPLPLSNHVLADYIRGSSQVKSALKGALFSHCKIEYAAGKVTVTSTEVKAGQPLPPQTSPKAGGSPPITGTAAPSKPTAVTPGGPVTTAAPTPGANIHKLVDDAKKK